MHVEELLDEEVTALAGARCARKAGAIEGTPSRPQPRDGGTGGAASADPRAADSSRRGERDSAAVVRALHGDRAVNDLLLTRVLYGISCRNYEAAAEVIPGAIGLSGSTVSRGFIQASAAEAPRAPRAGPLWRGCRGPGPGRQDVRRCHDGDRAGHHAVGEKRFLGFVETDTENAPVLTLFLPGVGRAGPGPVPGRAGDPRRRQGAAGGRSEGLPRPGPGATVSVAQARERGELPRQTRAGGVAAAPSSARTTGRIITRPSGRSRRSTASWTSGTSRRPAACGRPG